MTALQAAVVAFALAVARGAECVSRMLLKHKG
jgi:hypothetical protein